MTSKQINSKISTIKLFVTDVDGVLTDGQLFYGNEGLSHKGFHVQDGLGLKLLQRAGLHVAIITACKSQATRERMQQLGIQHCYLGEEDKRKAFQHLLDTLGIEEQHVAYVGDDLPDLPLIKRAGLGITVADGHPIIMKHADWITTRKGGEKAIREITDRILTVQNHWDTIEKSYLA